MIAADLLQILPENLVGLARGEIGMRKRIGERFRLFRTMNSMTQTEAALRIGVTKEHIGLVERGKSYPSMDMLVRAASAYGTELFHFFLLPEKDAARTDEAASDFVAKSCGVWTMDLAEGRDVWSEDLRRILGLPHPHKAAADDFFRIVRDRERPRAKRFFNTVRARGRPRPLRCTIVRADGIARRLLIQADQLEDEAGVPDVARLIIQDISDWAVLRNHLIRDRQHLEAVIIEKTTALRASEQEARAELDRRIAAERETRRQRENLERILTAVPAILYSFAPSKGGTEWHSPHMQAILGISQRELQDDPMLWHDSIHPDDLPMVDEAIRLAQKGHPIDVEYRINGRDGQWRWLHDRATPCRDETGAFRLAGVAVNVTERKRNEEDLRESRKMFQAVAEDIPALLCRYNPGCIITYVNEAYCRCFGKTRAELTGASFLELMPETAHAPFLAALAELTPDNSTVRTEHEVLDAAGQLRWHRWTDRALFDARGRVTAYQSVGEDVTESKQAREALERLSREYETILNTTHSSIFLISVDDRDRLVFDRLNPQEEKLTGLNSEAVRGKTPVEALGPEIGEMVQRNYRRCLELKRAISYEETLHLPGGKRTWLTHLSPVLDGDRVIKIVGSGQDITERVEAEQKHQRENERLRRENELLRQDNERLHRLPACSSKFHALPRVNHRKDMNPAESKRIDENQMDRSSGKTNGAR